MTGHVLTDNERNAIETVIRYKADQLRLPRLTVEQTLFRHLGVETLGQLMPVEFVGVIRHLLSLGVGANVD
jgi:hypothetical protein